MGRLFQRFDVLACGELGVRAHLVPDLVPVVDQVRVEFNASDLGADVILDRLVDRAAAGDGINAEQVLIAVLGRASQERRCA